MTTSGTGVTSPSEPSAAAARTRQGLILVAVSGVCFGTLGVFGKLGSRAQLTLPTLLALRFGAAALLLGAILAARGELRRPPLRQVGAVTVMGLLYVLQASCFFGSLHSVPAAVTSILLYTYPVVVTLLARLLFGERLTAVRIGALVIACAGVVLVVDPLSAGGLDTAGVLLGLGSAAAYSTYILCGSVLLRDIPALTATTGISLVAATAFVIVGALSGQLHGFDARGWLVVAGIAVVPTVVAASAFLAGLARVGPTVASTISTLEPASTALFAALVLGETLAAGQLAGGALVLVAAAVLARAIATTERVEAAAEH